MELSKFLRPVMKWWWLAVLSTMLAVSASYMAAEQQPTLYSSRTTLIVGSSISSLNPTNNDFQLARQLAGLYADIARREPVREATKDALGLNSLPGYTVSSPGNSQLIEIAVVDTNPERAQAVANELARQLIARIPENNSSITPEREQFTEDQLAYLEESIRETQAEIEGMQTELAGLNSALQIEDTNNQIAALKSKLSTLQSTYAAFLSTTDTGAINTISVIEPADLPTRPVNSDRWIYIAMSGLLGLGLAVAGAYLLDYLDDSLKTIEDILRITDLPVFGKVPRGAVHFNPRNGTQDSIVSNESPSIEAFRVLRANLEFNTLEGGLHSILVTGPTAGDGKSTVAANLAAAFARAEKRTLLIDSDTRNPSIHRILDISNFEGFRQLLTARAIPQSFMKPTTLSKHLWAIPAEAPTHENFEVLNAPRVREILTDVDREYDVTILDSPPSVLSEAAILASTVDGVILVVRLNHTPEGALRASLEQLKRADANIIGLVINDVPPMNSYEYMAYKYAPQDPLQLEGNGVKLISVIRKRVREKLGRKNETVPSGQVTGISQEE